MKKFKVCMLGAYAAGKTSLVRQYVFSIFSGKYQTTLGVKIDKKTLQINDETIDLILWDLAGQEELIDVRKSYLRGSAGGILVADGTRGETLDVVLDLKHKLYDEVGEVPIVLMVNKSDLKNSWDIDQEKLSELRDSGWTIFETSAKDGTNVNRAYQALTQELFSSMDK